MDADELCHAIDHAICELDVEPWEAFRKDPDFVKLKIDDAIKQLEHVKRLIEENYPASHVCESDLNRPKSIEEIGRAVVALTNEMMGFRVLKVLGEKQDYPIQPVPPPREE